MSYPQIKKVIKKITTTNTFHYFTNFNERYSWSPFFPPLLRLPENLLNIAIEKTYQKAETRRRVFKDYEYWIYLHYFVSSKIHDFNFNLT